MDNNHLEDLKSLHTALIDSRNGYHEALEDAEGKGLTPLFREMIARRERDAEALERHLVALGATPDQDGSFMSSVHRAVIKVRSLFGELDERILPGLIDGEQRILGYYDEALESVPKDSSESATLSAQRSELQSVISDMQRRESAAA